MFHHCPLHSPEKSILESSGKTKSCASGLIYWNILETVTPEHTAARAAAGAGLAHTGSGFFHCAREPRGLLDLGPTRPVGLDPPCGAQHPATSRGSPGRCGARGSQAEAGYGGGWAWTTADREPKTHNMTDAWLPGKSQTALF